MKLLNKHRITILFLSILFCFCIINFAQPKTRGKTQKPTPKTLIQSIDSSKIVYTMAEEPFFGPFESWGNVKADYGAVGDGITDDTKAIQRALDFLRFSRKKILYFPAGVYKITNTLTMLSQINIGIIGENPATTTIVWDGKSGGTMLDCNGVSYSHYGRITWDGNFKALAAINHGWDGKRPQANTDSEHADEVFKNLVFGIIGGSRKRMDAECVVKRCSFENCSKAGISIENFNAADWQIWDCVFKHCYLGVTTDYGAGYFNVYQCYFLGSRYADIAKNQCGFFAVRHCTSINSNMFFEAGFHACPGLVTLQDNKIYYPNKEWAIQIGDIGPSLIMDNVILAKKTNQYTASLAFNQGETSVSINNKFTSRKQIVHSNANNVTSINDSTINELEIPIVLPTMKSTPLPLSNTVLIDIPIGVNETIIQKMLDSTLKKTKKEIVIHFGAGNYYLANSIVLPANRKIYLIGDGFESRLIWASKKSDAILTLNGPSQVEIKELELNGKSIASGIEVQNCDQVGANIFMDQAHAKGSERAGILVDSLDNAKIYLQNFYHEGCKKASVQAIGGFKKASGIKTEGSVSIICGASSNNNISYDLKNNADLLVNDIWYESSSSPRFLQFNEQSSGNFTFNGGCVATGKPPIINGMQDSTFPSILVDGFKGNISFLNMDLRTRSLFITKKSSNTNLFAMIDGTGDKYFINENNNPNVYNWACTRKTPDGGGVTLKGLVKPSDAFIIKMLQQQRAQTPFDFKQFKKNNTDVKIYRVNVIGSDIAFHLKPY